MEALQFIGDVLDHVKAVEAKGLLYQAQSFEFLISLIRIWSTIFCLSQQLQENTVDLAKASDFVLATQETLQKYRQDDEWQKLYDYATQVDEVKGIDIQNDDTLHRRRAKRVLRRYEGTFIDESMFP